MVSNIQCNMGLIIAQFYFKLRKMMHIINIISGWTTQGKVVRLIHQWWNEFPIYPNNITISCQRKMRFLNKKIQGWTKEKIMKKSLDDLQQLEEIQEHINLQM